MKRLGLCLMFSLLTVLIANLANAALFTATIEGINPSVLIEGFSIRIGVNDGFLVSSSSFGDAIPNKVGNFGWSGDFVINNNILTIANSNWDYLMSDLSNPLRNGALFSINYTGSLNDFDRIMFFDNTGSTDNPFNVTLMNPATWKTDGVARFAAPVPIPAALYLLGSGLIGLVGLRRRFIN